MINLVALTALGVFTSVPALASSLNACNPGIEYFELEGFVTAATVSDGPLFEAPTDTFPIPSEAPLVKRILASRNRDQPTIDIGNNILYLETETERILFDTGNGVPNDDGFGGQLVANLEAQGITRESITRILLSHAHIDHIGGVLLNGGDTLAFPSATVHISRAEFDYWMGEGPPLSDSDVDADTLANDIATIPPILELIRPSIEFFDVGDEVLPGITAARDAPWHTPGSIIFRVSGGSGVPVFFLGTAVIDEQIGFGHPYIKISTDADQAASPIGRIELLDAIVAEKGLAVPSHVAFPGLGQVVPNGVYFDFFRIPPPTSVAVETTCDATGGYGMD